LLSGPEGTAAVRRRAAGRSGLVGAPRPRGSRRPERFRRGVSGVAVSCYGEVTDVGVG